MMTDTPEKSRPRAATSVHSSTPEVFLENSKKVFVRSACTTQHDPCCCWVSCPLSSEPVNPKTRQNGNPLLRFGGDCHASYVN